MIEDKLKRVQKKPGVYLLKDGGGRILYVGKAKNLRDRLRSHFRRDVNENPKHRSMMARVEDFETIVTDSEVEALILEANLVKEHRPKYNVNLKDDKSFPYIRVTDEPYPRIFITRKIVRDGSRYFGPYTEVGSMRKLTSAVQHIFSMRTCQLRITEETIRAKKHKICLNYHIGRCTGPCEGFVSREDYGWTVDQVVAFIRGTDKQLVQNLEIRMRHMALSRQFEEAAHLRDQIHSVSMFHSRQKVVDILSPDRDLITVAVEGEDACGVVFHVREGKLMNRQHFYLSGVDGVPLDEIMASFVKQYYLRADAVPDEIHFSSALSETADLKEWLSRKREKKVTFVFPKKGKKAQLMALCAKNARLLLEELQAQKSRADDWAPLSVRALQKDLRMNHPPKRIEAFDVSNIAGHDAVASLVVFENGKPKKSEYRKFKIKTVEGIDDYRMMAEAVERRVVRLQKEDMPMPDLILVDGGKGQLSTAVSVLQKMGIEDQPIVGLAKRLEEVFIPGFADPQNIPKHSASLHLLQRVRDEAHRFAVRYHRTLRKKRMVHSELDDIPGIGEKRRNALLKAFGSVEGVRKASLEELSKVDGMNRKAAEAIIEVLKK